MVSDLAFGMSNTAAGTDWNTTGTFSCVDITGLMCLSGSHLRMTLWKCVGGRYWGILNFRKGSGVVVLTKCLLWYAPFSRDSAVLRYRERSRLLVPGFSEFECSLFGQASFANVSRTWETFPRALQFFRTLDSTDPGDWGTGFLCARGSGAPSGDSIMNCSTSAMGGNWDRQVYPNDTKIPGRGCLASLG